MRKLFLLAVMSAATALGAACSSSSAMTECDCTINDAGVDASTDASLDAGSDATTCPVQSYPANAATCPTTYSASYAGQLCSPPGTQCNYPGAGDIGADGCASAAALLCEFRDSGLGEIPDAAIFDDAGDASVGYWTFAQ